MYCSHNAKYKQKSAIIPFGGGGGGGGDQWRAGSETQNKRS